MLRIPQCFWGLQMLPGKISRSRSSPLSMPHPLKQLKCNGVIGIFVQAHRLMSNLTDITAP